MTQGDVFFQGEGDAWFGRNKAVLTPDQVTEHDPVAVLLAQARVRPTAVLEVGAANGYRLAALARQYGCTATAVEPSESAIAEGRNRFPEVHFVRGLAHHLEGLLDAQFDLVIVHFVLHWVDRSRLLAASAELDRVLRDGGHLMVGDFYPEAPVKVRYHHLPDAAVWTYKQDYPSLWLASQLYAQVAELVFDHGTKAINPSVTADHRGRVTLLRKSLSAGYRPADYPRPPGGHA